MSETLMPWGKHRGKPLSAIPASYLWWAAEEPDVRYCNWPLYVALIEELKRRLVAACPSIAPAFDPPFVAALRVCYRHLAMQYHPDRGGSPEAMKAINEFHERLQDLIRGAADTG